MKAWTPEQLARASGATVASAGHDAEGPERVVIDSRQAGPGTFFVGLRGERVDGGEFAAQALAAGAWGVLVAPAHAQRIAAGDAVVLAAEEPLLALQRLATAWRRELGAKVIAVTGSTGKTTTKDILVSLLRPARSVAYTRANFNTEIGVPLEILSAAPGTEVLVLEHAMRGAGQIAELAAISEPDVAVIVNVGPVHLELLGSVEAIAAAKAELIAALREGGTAVVPVREPLLEPYLRPEIRVLTFGPGGDVSFDGAGAGSRVAIVLGERRVELDVPFAQPHLRTNLLAAAAAASAVGVIPSGRVEVAFSPGRGQRTELPRGITLIDDCYNANPMSVRAALDDLATTAAVGSSRRVAVLGDMLELGPAARDFHVKAGRHAAAVGVDVLVTVGPLAEAMADGFAGEVHAMASAAEAAPLVDELVAPGDVVLVKGSRGVGLEVVCSALTGERVGPSLTEERVASSARTSRSDPPAGRS
jgi:UDP-N-acetylmuramoyl-tripeptide--D-alanyl-D-alanine ligase